MAHPDPKGPMPRLSLPRLAGGALAAAALLAAAGTATAAAAPTCAFHAPSRTLQINDTDALVPDDLGVKLAGTVIVPVADGVAGPSCSAPPPARGQLTVAKVDTIVINAPLGTGQVTIDQAAGAFAPGFTAEPAPGTSEIEFQIIHKGADPRLRVIGTPRNDTIRIGAKAATALNADADVDVTTDFAASPVLGARIETGDGDDFVTGRGAGPQAGNGAAFPLEIFGGAGNDVLVDGLGRRVESPVAKVENDTLSAGPGADTISTDDGLGGDAVSGGEGNDRATSEPTSGQELREIPDTYTRTESIAFAGAAGSGSGGPLGQVGRLSLHAPRSVRAGGVANVGVRWTAPRTWRTLGAIDVRLYDGGAALGRARLVPRRSAVAGAGLLRRASRMTRDGRDVRARLAWRLPRALAGHDLRVAVEAVRRDGRMQSVPAAGLLHVR